MDTGQWQEEGRCLIKEDEQGKFCEGELAHFTSWNLDVPAGQEDCVRVKVTDSRTGTPLSGSEVLVTADRVIYSSGIVSTGVDGTSCINIPFGIRTTVTARSFGYKDSAVQVVTGTGVAGSMCALSTCPLYEISLVASGTIPTCRTPKIDCGGVCTDPDSDDNNCGSCGVVCSSGTICDSGSCECADPMQTLCSGTCINTSNDSSNCGACGRRCSSVMRRSTCQAGSCVCPGGTPTSCSAAASFQCVDTNSDNNNCGKCGVICASGSRCVSGVCVSPWKKITHPPMSIDDLYSVSAAGTSTILTSGKSGRMLFLKNPVTAPTWDVVNPRIGMTDVKDDLMSSYVFGRGYTFFAYGADFLLVGTQGALAFPNQTWSRSMAAPGHKFVAVTGVDPSGGGTVPEVFAVADDGTIANLSGAWKQNAATHPLQAVWAQRVPSSASAVELVAGGANGHLITARYENGSLGAGTLNTSRVVKDGVNAVEITGITGVLTNTILGLNKTLFVSGVVGTGGVIMRSGDGGNTFTRVHSSAKPLRGIAMSGSEVFAVGDTATVVRGSMNGGAFQVEALSGETADLRAVFLNSEVVIVVGKQTSWRRTF